MALLLALALALALCNPLWIQGFVPSAPAVSHRLVVCDRSWWDTADAGSPPTTRSAGSLLSMASTTTPPPSEQDDDDGAVDAETTERNETIGNLVADDEWAGVTMKLSQLIRKSIEEDLKQKAREFLGKEEYALGDLSKEIDARVKQGVADIRGKDGYELGDLTLTLDEMSKNFTEGLTGQPYEAGDLSKEIDARVKVAVAKYVGVDEYAAGDLTRFVAANVQSRVADLTANYEFGDISREIERQRKEWIKGFLGDEAAANYKFGDISKKLATKITGKEAYQFGDVTRTLMGNMFGNKKDKKDDK
jgi:HAMP domain-containing protein